MKLDELDDLDELDELKSLSLGILMKQDTGAFARVPGTVWERYLYDADVWLRSWILGILMIESKTGAFTRVPGTVWETASWTLPLAGAERPL